MATTVEPNSRVLDPGHWDRQYVAAHLPWETGRPSSELKQLVRHHPRLTRGRAVDLGCGTGVNAVWLAQQGFSVTAIDLSRRALERARRRAALAAVAVDFRVGDLTQTGCLSGPFDFFLDRGCYHAVRLAGAEGYFRAVRAATRPGALGLVLMGNAAEPEDLVGPPVLDAWQIRAEWGAHFEIVRLRPFRFDARPGEKRYLGWSCLVRRLDERRGLSPPD